MAERAEYDVVEGFAQPQPQPQPPAVEAVVSYAGADSAWQPTPWKR
jgi:hypothetical protein